MERAISALRNGSRHLNLVAFDRGGSGGELYSYEVSKDRPRNEEEDSVGIRGEAAAHEYPVGEEGATAVAKHICLSQSLTQLSLHGNSIQDSDKRIAPSAMTTNGIAAICEALKNNKTLQYFSIKSLDMSEQSAKNTAEVLETHPTLTYLSLVNSGMGIRQCITLSKVLQTSILNYLELSRNDIGGSGTELICNGLVKNNSIETLVLECIGLDQAGARALSLMLPIHSVLKKLMLSCNYIGDNGACDLAKGLKENKTLEYLDLTMNCIGNKGCIAIANSTPDSLTSLVLRNNRVQESACPALVTLIKNSCSLSLLNLELNFISDGSQLIKAAINNKNLTHLDLSGNAISDQVDQMSKLSEILRERQKSNLA